MLILGIESSCDDAAAAVIETDRPGVATVRASSVANQDDIHRAYGGIVPELASRNHVITIMPVIDRALAGAGCTLNDLDGITVTRGPGLVGSLLVGLMCAKGLAQSTGIAVVDFGRYRRLGTTRDDAAGEAFDKVAKLMGLGYPGGKIIDELSREGVRDRGKLPRASERPPTRFQLQRRQDRGRRLSRVSRRRSRFDGRPCRQLP